MCAGSSMPSVCRFMSVYVFVLLVLVPVFVNVRACAFEWVFLKVMLLFLAPGMESSFPQSGAELEHLAHVEYFLVSECSRVSCHLWSSSVWPLCREVIQRGIRREEHRKRPTDTTTPHGGAVPSLSQNPRIDLWRPVQGMDMCLSMI